MAASYKTKSGDVRWRALWRDDQGKQKSKTFSTRDLALKWEEKMRTEAELGTLGINTRARDTLLDDWLVEWWDLHIKDRPGNTRASYARAVNGVISPYIGRKPMSALRPDTIAAWRDDLTKDGFSAHQVIEGMKVLGSSLSKARERGLLVGQENPVHGISMPPKSPRQKVEPLTPEHCEWLRMVMLNHIAGKHGDYAALRSATMVSVLVYGGVRPEELMGLKVRDLELDEGGFFFHGAGAGGITINDVFAMEHRESDTKTHVSGRFVDLPGVIMDELRFWLEVREEREGMSKPGDFLFPDINGTVSPSTYKNWRAREWNRARKKAAALVPSLAPELLKSTPYTARHSCVSFIARAEGADLDRAALAERMGHTVQTMESTYLHVIRKTRNRERISVEEQIAVARRKTGAETAYNSLRGRLAVKAEPKGKLISLEAKRQRVA